MAYEFLILKSPLSSRTRTQFASRRVKVSSHENEPPVLPDRDESDETEATSQKSESGIPLTQTDEGPVDLHKPEKLQPPNQDSFEHSPPTSPNPKVVAVDAEEKESNSTGALQSRESISPVTPLKRVKHARHTDSEKQPASALRLESVPADADTNAPAVEEEPSKQSSGNSGSNKSVSTGEKSRDEDIDPPARRAHPPEKGAEPGAGENFWQWFQDTKGSEKGAVSKGAPCKEENKRLCQMFYKYLRKYKIRSLFDASCAKNVDWMPDVLRKVGNELWGFKYYCSLPDEEDAKVAKPKLDDIKFVEFVNDQWWRSGYPEGCELVFAWDVLPHIAYGRVWNFFVKARKQNIKYVLVDNYPGILNDPVSSTAFRFLHLVAIAFVHVHRAGVYPFPFATNAFSDDFLPLLVLCKRQSPTRNYLNIRKHPFRFPAAKEVVQNVTEPGEKAKRQLLFYETEMLPDNLQ